MNVYSVFAEGYTFVYIGSIMEVEIMQRVAMEWVVQQEFVFPVGVAGSRGPSDVGDLLEIRVVIHMDHC